MNPATTIQNKPTISKIGRIELPEEGVAQDDMAALYDALPFPEVTLKNAIHPKEIAQKVHALPILQRAPVAPIMSVAPVSVIESQPIMRDLIKESAIFMPTSLRNKKK